MNKITTTVELLVDAAKAGLKSLGQQAKSTGEDIEDLRTPGQKAADELTAAAAEIMTELKRTGEVAAALRQELGDVADAVDVEKAVNDLRRLGLSFEEIEADAKPIAGAIRSMDDAVKSVNPEPMRKLDGEITRISEHVGNNRSVIANFMGNWASELPGVTGAFGPLNMAIGQTVEYATEGNINIRNMAKAAGPMIGLSVATQVVSKHFAEAAKIKAFNADQVETFTDAVRGATDPLKALVEVWKSAGKIEVDLFGDVLDLTPMLAAAGISVEQFNTLVTDSTGKQAQAWKAAAESAGVDGGLITAILAGVTDQQGKYSEAVAGSAAANTVFGDSTEKAAGKAGHASEEQRRYEAALLDGAAAARESKKETDAKAEADEAAAAATAEHRQRVDELYGSLMQLVGGDIAVREANRAASQAVGQYRDTVAEGKATTDQLTAAQDAAASSILRAAQAAAENEIATREAAGEALSMANKTAIQREALDNLARTLEPGSPLRAQIDGYVTELGEVPTDVRTALRADADAESIAAAELALQELARERLATVRVRLAGGTLTNDGGIAFGGGAVARATGGPLAAGQLAQVNERGHPEMFTDSQGRQYFMPAKPGIVTPLEPGSAGRGTVNVNVNLNALAITPEVSAQLAAWIESYFRGQS